MWKRPIKRFSNEISSKLKVALKTLLSTYCHRKIEISVGKSRFRNLIFEISFRNATCFKLSTKAK